MKVKIYLHIFLILVIISLICFIFTPRADARSGSDKVRICGKVTGKYDENGLLYIAVNRVINNVEEPKFTVISSIDSSGEYCVEAPKGIGDVNITVFNPLDAMTELIKYHVPFAIYSKNPLKIEDKDIMDVDIVFKRPGTPVLIDDYSGPTVSISGRVFMDNYKEGHIGITVNVGSPGPPGVNIVTIEGPGEYSLKVPKNFGDIYIAAYNTNKGSFKYYMGIYSKNPILVKDEDIKGIDIIIE